MVSGTYQLTGVAKRNYGGQNEAGDTQTWKLNRYALSQGKYERRGIVQGQCGRRGIDPEP